MVIMSLSFRSTERRRVDKRRAGVKRILEGASLP